MDHPEEHTIAKINNLQTQIDNLLSIVVEIKNDKAAAKQTLEGAHDRGSMSRILLEGIINIEKETLNWTPST